MEAEELEVLVDDVLAEVRSPLAISGRYLANHACHQLCALNWIMLCDR